LIRISDSKLRDVVTTSDLHQTRNEALFDSVMSTQHDSTVRCEELEATLATLQQEVDVLQVRVML
jgi:hypothetical protein